MGHGHGITFGFGGDEVHSRVTSATARLGLAPGQVVHTKGVFTSYAMPSVMLENQAANTE